MARSALNVALGLWGSGSRYITRRRGRIAASVPITETTPRFQSRRAPVPTRRQKPKRPAEGGPFSSGRAAGTRGRREYRPYLGAAVESATPAPLESPPESSLFGELAGAAGDRLGLMASRSRID